MKILTLENKYFDVDEIGEEVGDINFWVLEYANENTDYFVKPLLFLETFSNVRVQVKIGEWNCHFPKDWSILCADKEMGEAELIPFTLPGINQKKFTAFSFNPMTGFRPQHFQVETQGILPETKWVLPKLKYGQLLCSPLTDDENPPCVFVTHQKLNKVPEVLNINYLL